MKDQDPMQLIEDLGAGVLIVLIALCILGKCFT